jgi:hypothetical protein
MNAEEYMMLSNRQLPLGLKWSEYLAMGATRTLNQ